MNINLQVYLMGANKSERLYPKPYRDLIAMNLIDVYSTQIDFDDEFETSIMDIFGSDYADGVNVGTYSYLAKKLEESGLIKVMNQINPNEELPSGLNKYVKGFSDATLANGVYLCCMVLCCVIL